MSNHYHVVLHVDKDRALNWSKKEAAERWLAEPGSIDKATMCVIEEIIESWRERLYDISWFYPLGTMMRGVNECIARMVNTEENCKGRFWEGRIRSQALLTKRLC